MICGACQNPIIKGRCGCSGPAPEPSPDYHALATMLAADLKVLLHAYQHGNSIPEKLEREMLDSLRAAAEAGIGNEG